MARFVGDIKMKIFIIDGKEYKIPEFKSHFFDVDTNYYYFDSELILIERNNDNKKGK